ncbi:lysophospholipid acyltransferase family protein [Kiloniella laminariae]|uniref:lysophospholipid acyltransferase family protein n=1 Tax=Kiloniella laminariae TaxID=454162 RepID=UPI000371B3E1|nr:lysophospholipid acyltransferase family protein [Kiloniella laminariae]
MIFLRSLTFNVCYLIWCLLYFTPCLLLMVFPQRFMLVAGHYWAIVVFWLLKVICGTTYEIRGVENRPKDQGFLLVSKHQSAWETIALMAFNTNPCFILKKELLRIPMFGWYLWKGGVVAIDRKAGTKALRQMIKESQKPLSDKRPIIIFPEGTRATPGQEPSYQTGIAALYTGLGVTVSPVALNSGLFWGRDAFVKKPGKIIMEYLPPIPPGLDRKAFMKRMQDTIEEASNRLMDEARQAEAKENG